MIARQFNSVVVNNPPSISSGALPPFYVGIPVSHVHTTSGGQAPFGQWAVAATNDDNTPSVLPAGLSLNPVTGELFGSPTTAAGYDFTIQIPDANG